MGSTAVILNCFTVFPSVTDIIFGVVRCNLNGPSYIRLVSWNTRTASPCLIGYFVPGGSFYVIPLLISSSTKPFSMSIFAVLVHWIVPFRLVLGCFE